MSTFGKRMAELRKDNKISQAELAKMLSTSTSVVGRYERDEMTPSIEAAKKIATILDTTVAFLIGENEQSKLFRDPSMLDRLKDLQSLLPDEQTHILFAIDAMLRDAKARKAYA